MNGADPKMDFTVGFGVEDTNKAAGISEDTPDSASAASFENHLQKYEGVVSAPQTIQSVQPLNPFFSNASDVTPSVPFTDFPNASLTTDASS